MQRLAYNSIQQKLRRVNRMELLHGNGGNSAAKDMRGTREPLSCTRDTIYVRTRVGTLKENGGIKDFR